MNSTDQRISTAIDQILHLVSGQFGAMIMVLFGIIAIATFQLWLPVVAFARKWWWGLVVLFVPCGSLVFGYFHWNVAKRPILIGCCALIGGLLTFVIRSFIASFLLEVAVAQ